MPLMGYSNSHGSIFDRRESRYMPLARHTPLRSGRAAFPHPAPHVTNRLVNLCIFTTFLLRINWIISRNLQPNKIKTFRFQFYYFWIIFTFRCSLPAITGYNHSGFREIIIPFSYAAKTPTPHLIVQLLQIMLHTFLSLLHKNFPVHYLIHPGDHPSEFSLFYRIVDSDSSSK